MAIHYYNKNENHPLAKQTADIYVSVISGNGQGGSYIILLDAEFMGANEKVNIGKAANCKGKDLKVIVTIQDKLEETNWTGVIVIISEGGTDTRYAYAEELPKDLDIACYNINIKLK